MKLAAIALVVATLGAGSALASVTDADFLRANRCRGLAASLNGVVNTATLDAFVKAERGTRAPYVSDRAQTEFERARREAKRDSNKDRLIAELSGPCLAYAGAKRDASKP